MEEAFVFTGGKPDIRTQGSHRCLRFAAAELQKYAARMVSGAGPGGRVYMGAGADFCRRMGLDPALFADDGFAVAARGGALVLASLVPRGVLFAVYEFLRQNGCRFVKAAGVGEYVPTVPELRFSGRLVRNPSFAERSLCVSVHEPHDKDWDAELSDVVDWCAKNCINTLFFSFSDLHFPLAEAFPAVLSGMADRDLRSEYGGHGLEKAVPRALFASQPERFIERGGRRVPEGNFCVSDPRNLNDVAADAARLFGSVPGLSVLHPWFQDVPEGSWCACPHCAALPPAAQQMRAVNAVARTLRQSFPAARAGMLFYQSTMLDAAATEPPEPNVGAVFAPRERCYAHGLDDASCALNAAVRERLDAITDRFGADNVTIYDYYADYVLFSRMKAALPRTIAADMAYYKAKGIRRVCALSFGAYSFWAYDRNLYAFARHAFDARADVAETEAAFRDDLRLPAAFDEYAAFSARFSEKAFALCGYPFQAYCDIRNPQRGAYYARHIGLIEEAVAALRRARAALPRVRRAAESRLAEYFEAEERILRITDAEIRLLLGQMRRQYALAAGDIDTKQAKRYLAVIGRKLKTVLDIAADVPAAVKGVSGKGFFAELGTVHRNVYGDTLRDNNVHFPIGAMCDGSHV